MIVMSVRVLRQDMIEHSECLQRGRMSQERLLASLCAACQLPPPLYDLEVTGGHQVTVCCIVGRSDSISGSFHQISISKFQISNIKIQISLETESEYQKHTIILLIFVLMLLCHI